MKTIKEITINNLKKLTAFLEKRWYKSKPKNSYPINSLAPKVLTEEEDIKKIQPYLNSLKQSIDTEGINNIAITGSYGSGKSTILNTFQDMNEGYEYLNISLASFKDNKENSDNPEFERRLEVSILQQMFYHVEPSVIPDSRFKRIINLTPEKLFLPSLFLVLWSFSALILIKFNYIEKLNPEDWKHDYPINWLTLFTSLVFFIGIGLFVKRLYRLFMNSKINKLNIKGELELGESVDKSVFNQHIEEILYFFERTEFNVVIIEDVDRFDSTDIFTKLREINILINNSNLIKRPVKFIYAIKDEMFKDKNERVKFFDFIIPVISFINPSNASDQLTKLIANAKLEGELSADFTSDVVTFIDDIDMRLLINTFHEYQLYKTMLSKDLNQNNLFAIIVYKNLYPDDFGDLQKRKGKLYEFFSNKPTYIKSIIEKHQTLIEEINKQIEVLENEVDRPVKELRAAYIIKLVSKLDKFHAFHINGKNVSLEEVLEDEHFKNIKTATSITYITYVAQNNYPVQINPSPKPITSIVSFLEIEKELSNNLTYNQREKLIIDKANNQINILKSEKEKLKREINETELKSIQELFEVVSTEEHLGCFKENNLMRNLLLNGYIDEHYDDYISLFHGINLTKDDFTFERKIKSGYNLPFDHTITKTENLIKRLPDNYFRKEEILNYHLLNYLLENESKQKDKIDHFFKCLSIDGEKQFEFINGYIKYNPNKINPFIKKLCAYKPSLWQYLNEKSNLPEDEIQGLLKHIFDYADKNSILKFNSLESLELHISQMDDFFAFCSLLKQTNTIHSFITERKIQLENLDIPDAISQKIFDSIYTKSLYQLNRHNIIAIIKGNGKSIDENQLNTSHYSILLNSDLNNLLDYIDDNIEYFLEHVILLQESNTEEEEKTIVNLLNRDDVNNDLKTQLIRSQNAKINSLEDIEDVEVKRILLENNKVYVKWDNIFDYHDSAEEEEFFDDTLIEFLNKKENYTLLSKSKLSVSNKEEDYIKKLSNILIQSDTLEVQAYTSLVDSLPYTYNQIEYDSLKNDKILVLLSKKILNLTSSNFDGLKLKSSGLHIKLIEMHQNKLAEKLDELSMETEDYVLILKSTAISVTNRLNFIQQMGDDRIINNSDIAKEVCLLLPEDKIIPLSHEVLSALFDTRTLMSKKISLLNLNLNKLESNQVKVLIEKLGGEYVKIFKKQNKPSFDNNTQHILLFENLKKRNLIIRYEIKEKKIKVFAKY
ncbi:MAG: hypothetical protein KFKLKKLM_01249 [Flavobacteriales bacterium]|nr:hypothetical protein [Flavobacteriales bacterium]